MKKLVMTQSVCKEGLDLLEGKAKIFVANDGDPNNYLDEMKDADGIIVRIGKMDKTAIENSPNLKVIGRTGVGYDSIDVETATKHGIPIVVTPGANTHSVAEHTLALMFAISKDIVEYQIETAKGNFSKIRNSGKVFELAGKKVGFIGLGNIGRETAKLCSAIGMKILGYDPFLSKEAMEKEGWTYFKNYEDLLKEADIVSLHVPLLPTTKNMIGLKQLKMMKKTGIIINCSRGGLINEDDLVEALNNDIIAGAGTDVFEVEPPEVGGKLMTAKNLVFSPHSAAQTREAVVNMATMCVNGCLAVMNGEQWPYVANKEAYNHPKWKK